MAATGPDDALEPVRQALASLGETLEPTAAEALLSFRDLIATKNPDFALISASDVAKIIPRHFAECARLLRWIPRGAPSVLDFGSGAGLPGIVFALLRPEAVVTLLEARRRKQVFLRLAVTRLGIRGAHVFGTLDEVALAPPRVPRRYERVAARAVAPLVDLLPLVVPAVERGGWLITPKGTGADEELRASERTRADLGLELLETRRESLTSAAGERITSTVFVFAKT